MNVFSKVLVVIVLLLSCGFVVSQMLLNSRREEWRAKYDDVNGQLATQKTKAQQLTTQSADLQQKLDNLRASSALEINALRDDVDGKTRQIAALGLDKEAYQAEAERSGTRVTSLEGRLNAKDAAIESLSGRNHELDGQLKGALDKVASLQGDVRDKDNKIDELDGQVALLNKSLRETSQDRDALIGKLAYLQGIGVNVEILSGTIPMVDARVVQADNEIGSVVLDKGKNDNIEIGMAFAIYRGTTLIAKAEVVQLTDDRCLAQVDHRLDNMPVEMGDRATTRF